MQYFTIHTSRRIVSGFNIVAASWITLGFYRGSKWYCHEHKLACSYDPKHKPPFFYTSMVCVGIFGAGFYLNPFTLLFALYKECNRLEITLRNLEKPSDYDKLW